MSRAAGDSRVEKLALELQARGPDEFPFGYYVYLAEEKLGMLKDEDDDVDA